MPRLTAVPKAARTRRLLGARVSVALLAAACGGKSSAVSFQQCPAVIEVQRAYHEENPQFGGPCRQCMSKCSAMGSEGCEAQNSCIDVHCDCTIFGCPSGIPEDDFCACAATCVGPGQQVCLQPWLDYGRCLTSACAGVCP